MFSPVMPETLEKDLRINIHDLPPETMMLRMVSPEEYFEALKEELSCRHRIETIGVDFEEPRTENGKVSIDGYEIFYQVCGMFHGDEFLVFQKGLPKKIADEALAVLSRYIALEEVEQEGICTINGVKFCTPEAFMAEQEGRQDEYHRKKLTKAQKAIEDASQVLDGRKSYLDSFLADYQTPLTFAEGTELQAEEDESIKSFIQEKFPGKSDTDIFLIAYYFEWRLKPYRFLGNQTTFRSELEELLEARSTAEERGWGGIIRDLGKEKHQKEIEAMKQILSNPDSLSAFEKEASQYVDELSGRLKALEETFRKEVKEKFWNV